MSQLSATSSVKARLRFAAIFTAGILVAEVVGGIWTGSLALLSDAAHVFMDLFALSLSLVAIYLSSLPADDKRTFGWHRAEVFAAFINGATLTGISLLILYESYQRALSPREIKSLEMIVIASLGLLANLVVLLRLRGHGHRDLNLRSAFLHVLSDFTASIGVVIAGLLIYLTNWTLADSVISAAIGVAILIGGLRVLRESAHILLEGVPRGLDVNEVADTIKGIAGVKDVHQLHLWCVCSNLLVVSSHILIDTDDRARSDEIIGAVDHMLRERFGVSRTTLQLDVVPKPGDALLEDLSH